MSESQRLSDKGIYVPEDSSPRRSRGSNICVTQAKAPKACILKSSICTRAYSIIIAEPWLLLCLQETGTKTSNCFPPCSVFSVYKIIIPSGARCCVRHLENGKMVDDAMQQIRTNESTALSKTFILSLIKNLREKAFQQSSLDFDDECCVDDDKYKILTGFTRQVFHDIVSSVTSINSTRNRSKRTCIAILLMKLSSALSNKLLAVLFHMTKFQVRRAIVSARTSPMRDFVPHNLGFNHITRESRTTPDNWPGIS